MIRHGETAGPLLQGKKRSRAWVAQAVPWCQTEIAGFRPLQGYRLLSCSPAAVSSSCSRVPLQLASSCTQSSCFPPLQDIFLALAGWLDNTLPHLPTMGSLLTYCPSLQDWNGDTLIFFGIAHFSSAGHLWPSAVLAIISLSHASEIWKSLLKTWIESVFKTSISLEFYFTSVQFLSVSPSCTGNEIRLTK